jgi:hypothetical protein
MEKTICNKNSRRSYARFCFGIWRLKSDKEDPVHKALNVLKLRQRIKFILRTNGYTSVMIHS